LKERGKYYDLCGKKVAPNGFQSGRSLCALRKTNKTRATSFVDRNNRYPKKQTTVKNRLDTRCLERAGSSTTEEEKYKEASRREILGGNRVSG